MHNNWIQYLNSANHWQKYSQCGEEGIIEAIFKKIGTENRVLADFGAGDGLDLSNTRYFLEEGWRGFLYDGGTFVKQMPDVVKAWITLETLPDLIKDIPNGFDLLSLDLDGNDFWYLDYIMAQRRPRLVVAEINGCIPAGQSRTIQYNPEHRWQSDDYYGFSFDAGLALAARHNYRVIYQQRQTNIFMIPAEIDDQTGFQYEAPQFEHVQYHKMSLTPRPWVYV